MKIGVLTSSRADYGIYLPLLRKLEKDEFFELEIIAFGTHTSKFHGYTVEHIISEFNQVKMIDTVLANDSATAISTSYALTTLKFADFWSQNQFDLVFCLGDRYEMNAAVQAGIPYGVNYAHLHGGETTLGAIDNIYRDQLTHASVIHFTATENAFERVKLLKGSHKNVYCTGSLSLEGIDEIETPAFETVSKEFNLPKGDFALVTFHPETVNSNQNYQFADEMFKALTDILERVSLVVTMPNADTEGQVYREKLYKLYSQNPRKVRLIQNFGKANYFSVMKASKFLLGNTSSGIVEAASFGKYVVNVGDRQKGREQSKNIIDVSFDFPSIIKGVEKAEGLGDYNGDNIYYQDNPSSKIVDAIKQFDDEKL